jgi:hypothetical protein
MASRDTINVNHHIFVSCLTISTPSSSSSSCCRRKTMFYHHQSTIQTREHELSLIMPNEMERHTIYADDLFHKMI